MEVKILTEHAKLGEIFSRNLNATKESQLKFEQTIKSFDTILKEFSLSLMKEQNEALKAFRTSLVESATIFKAAYEQEGRSLEREKERESLIAELKKNIDEIDKEANSVIEKNRKSSEMKIDKNNEDQSSFWVSYADLMAGLLFVFMLLIGAVVVKYVLTQNTLENKEQAIIAALANLKDAQGRNFTLEELNDALKSELSKISDENIKFKKIK